jgi:hypothetical protein
MTTDAYEVIRNKRAFEVPTVHQRMEREEFFAYKNAGQRYDPVNRNSSCRKMR